MHTSSKSSSFGISAGINSPILDRAKQVAGAVSQVKNGDTAGGAMEVINAATGTIKGLADNQGTRQTNYDANGSVGKQGAKNASANNNFYANIGVNAGISKSKSTSNTHTENAVVTTMKPADENSSITYNNVNNITYQGTQAQGGTFIYNNVANIQKEAVELHNSYTSSSSSRGINAGATIGYGHKIQTTGNGGSISVSRSNRNTVETIHANGNFTNVNEVHNNTGTMTLSGFNQEGGKVTGNIGNLVVESRQNTSTTTGSSKGMSVGVSSQGIPTSVNVNASRTNGNRAFVDNQSTFVVGEGSNLHVGTVENTGAVIGKEGNSTFKIDTYAGKDIQNYDTMTTTGGSIGASLGGKPKITNVGFNQDSRDKQGITRNTVVGDVEIAEDEGSPINRDLEKANEITKDTHSRTNINVEPQVIEYLTNPGKLKEDIGKAKKEISDVTTAIKESIHDRGDDNRNFFGQLREVRLSKTVNNIAGKRLTEAQKSEDVVSAWKDAYKDLGYNLDVKYTTGEDTPEMKDKAGTAYVSKDGVHTIIININAKENSTKAGLIGTLAEEASHIVNGVAGRQIATGTEEKGLESTGRAANAYFQEEYKGNNQNMTYKSDGKIDTSKLGTNVGDKIIIRKSEIADFRNFASKFADYDIETSCINGKCEVTGLISKNENSQKEAARFLIELVKNDPEKEVYVTFDAQKFSGFTPDKDNPVDKANLNINNSSQVWTIVKNVKTGEIDEKITPKEIEGGHEFIHAAEFIKGISYEKDDYVPHWYVDTKGKIIQEGEPIRNVYKKIDPETGKPISIGKYQNMLNKDKEKLRNSKNETIREMFEFCQNKEICNLPSGKTTREEFEMTMNLISKFENQHYSKEEIDKKYKECSIQNNCQRVIIKPEQIEQDQEFKEILEKQYGKAEKNLSEEQKELDATVKSLNKKCLNGLCFPRVEARTVGIGNKTKNNAKRTGVYGEYNNIEDKDNIPKKITSLEQITENLLRIQGGYDEIRVNYGGGKKSE